MEITREEARKLLSNVPEHRVFRCCDGRLIRNIRDLGKTLAHMPEDSFRYHANQDKNDFSRWVKETVGDEKLAGNLNRASDRKQALRELSDRISFLSGQLAQ
jgi:hypothetical protein